VTARMNESGDGSEEPNAGAGQPVIVLGAGRGTRFGTPKLFAEHEGRTFLERILTRCRESGARVTLVSDPRDRQRLEALLAGMPPDLLAPFPRIVAGDGEAPMLASVQAALRQGPYRPGWWLWPVDAPFLSAAGWRKAVQSAAGAPGQVWKLRVEGRTGHPIWFPERFAATILAGNWPDGLRGCLDTMAPEEISILALEGETVHDINTQEQLTDLASKG